MLSLYVGPRHTDILSRHRLCAVSQYPLLLGLTGCASIQGVDFAVTSVPDSVRVDVDGTELGVTPFTLSLNCERFSNGDYNSYRYKLKAFPPPGSGGTTQTKLIYPCQWRNTEVNKIHFDLMLEPISPTQNVNLNIDKKDSPEEAKLKRVKLLKRMVDEGLLTREEYKERVDIILSE